MGQESWMLAIGVRDRQPVSRRHRERHSGYLQRLLPSAVRSYQSTHRRFIWLGFQLQGGLLRSNRLETTRTAAGYAANCVLHGAHDVDSIDENAITDALRDSIALQVFSDGGFNCGVGAAAFVVTCVEWNGECWYSTLLGARGLMIEGARSAFHSEVAALDLAVEFIQKLVCRR